MFYLGLILRNALRHKLRSLLTLAGLVVAILAFGLISTVVGAWYANSEAASNARLVTRNAISLAFSMPISYKQKIRSVEGVKDITYANWFGGIYKDPKNFFPQFAIDPESYLRIYRDYLLPEDDLRNFIRDRKSCIVGRRLAQAYGFKVGDTLTLKGSIFPGDWEFVVRGIYDGREAKTDTSQLFFHWELLNETMKKVTPRRANYVGVYVVEIANPEDAAPVSQAIDALFKNSAWETLTETEQAFQLGFVSMIEAIVVAIRLMSYVVIVIILAVMANTMAMTARERLSEYATLKALGFSPRYVAALIFGESLTLAAIGAVFGIALTFPAARGFSALTGTLFPTMQVADATVWRQVVSALIVGVLAAAVPAWRAARVKIVDGLRSIG
ncbi:MAG TPA: FtsX-like permease family protein [Burkholderiales bacterium]|jgi:putative ABC transport system permease protein|nr:FtsX-like permease family protein [Burkholderiales bacterium]